MTRWYMTRERRREGVTDRGGAANIFDSIVHVHT